MTWYMVDVETDGPIPGEYSMIQIGAVIVEPGLERTFYGELKPISSKYDPDALRAIGITNWDVCTGYDHPRDVMERFEKWIMETKGTARPRFISDNNGFDWMFVCWYFWRFLERNPFGYSSTNLSSFYRGLTRDMSTRLEHLRETPHTHHPVDDARGNAEAMMAMMALTAMDMQMLSR